MTSIGECQFCSEMREEFSARAHECPPCADRAVKAEQERDAARAALDRLIKFCDWASIELDTRIGPRDDGNARTRDNLVRFNAALDAARKVGKP
jgi:hypothetical protein